MSTELAVALVSTLGVVVVAFVERGRRASGHAARSASRAATAATAAAGYAQPTGNGYADRTEAALSRIEAAQAEARRDIGGMRSEIRDLRRADDRLHQRITDLHREEPPRE